MEEILASIRRIISDDVAGESEAARTVSLVEVVETAPEADDAPLETAAPGPDDDAPTAAEEAHEASAPLDPAAPSEALADEPDAALQVAESAPAPVATPSKPVQREAAPAVASAPAAVFVPARSGLSTVERAVHAELDGLAGSLHAQVMAAVTRSVETLSPKAFPETVDMQVQAKPAVVSSRPASTHAERRTAEEAYAEVARAEPRSLLARAALAEADSRPNRLVSGAAGESVANSFGALSRTVASNTRSMEDVVTDALRPMLRSWLDENLPELVERLVRAEIERVARHGQ
ncbi:DUF2497 domain-containing protein [Ancylobacter sonchi]|uniref:PopZ family protein n=1 Tax=Ancylobacter sonchi TaxID=1937790 RepID=UPI001BD5E7FF|nr:DUF2497 domain-containing protein [Ancylobacter sonchi]MBS7532156.1 DUF2497 domain-containing protein [Ancylobacter sonchi]